MLVSTIIIHGHYLAFFNRKKDGMVGCLPYKNNLIAFTREHGHKIAAFYTENESGAMLERPQLMQLIDDASFGLYK